MMAAAARKDYQNPELKGDLVKALEERGGIIKGNHIEKIECPQCREKKGYSYVDNPFAIYCNRQKNVEPASEWRNWSRICSLTS